MHKHWQTGIIEPWWDLDHRTLAYTHEPFNNLEDLDLWRRLGYTQQRFTGEMYDMRFPEPAWIQGFRTQFPMQHFCWSVYCMRPGDVLPPHRDTYNRFRQVHNITNTQDIVRYVIFLEPWRSGHYFEIAEQPLLPWQAGTWVCWHGDVAHAAANVGKELRYTLQLTGWSPHT